MLTDQRRKYAEFRVKGYSKREAAIAAGCPPKTATQAAARLERNEHVQMAIAALNGGEPLPLPVAPRPQGMKLTAPPPAAAKPVEEEPDPLPVTKDPIEFLEAVMVCPRVPITERNKAAIKLADLQAKKKQEAAPRENKFRKPALKVVSA